MNPNLLVSDNFFHYEWIATNCGLNSRVLQMLMFSLLLVHPSELWRHQIMQNFPMTFSETPLVHETCQWFSPENITVIKENWKQSSFWISANSAPPQCNCLIFKCTVSQFSNYSFIFNEIKFAPPNLHSPWTALNGLLCPMNCNPQLFVEEEYTCCIAARRICNVWKIEKGIKFVNAAPYFKH